MAHKQQEHKPAQPTFISDIETGRSDSMPDYFPVEGNYCPLLLYLFNLQMR